jgi:hypothetical protein
MKHQNKSIYKVKKIKIKINKTRAFSHFIYLGLLALIGLTFQNPQNAVAIVDLLEKRLKENSWIVNDKDLNQWEQERKKTKILHNLDYL